MVNGSIVATSVAALVAVGHDEADPNSWHILDHQAELVSCGLLVLGILGELATLALHDDDPPPIAAPPVLGFAPSASGSTALTTLRVAVP